MWLGKAVLTAIGTSGWAVESDRLLKEPKEASWAQSCNAGTPTWQQVVTEVGPGPTLVWPGWTGHPQEIALRSQQQGPHQEAGGICGGTLEQ